MSTVEVFDPSTGMWTFGPELPNALCGAGQSEETISIDYNLLLNSKTYYRHYEIILLILKVLNFGHVAKPSYINSSENYISFYI